ncbi:hypothetical protein MUDAN_DOGOELCO_03411 [Lactiplantibacillus mudanjiangensis]|nr:hypothetical protein MUDAN_DOGOELCO_03411 [Lactiplantibacillus mudanjiangensis]
MAHRAGVERGDLVVVEVGRDHRLRGERVRNLRDMRCRDTELVQVVHIRARILADRAHDDGLAAEHLQREGDVACAATELPAHGRHQEGNVQDVDLVGQDVFAEVSVERHDGVVGNRAADHAGHIEALQI